MSEREIAVEVTFPLDEYGFTLDEVLHEVAGRLPEGSGATMVGDKERDVHWIASDPVEAWELLTKLHDALEEYPKARACIRVFRGIEQRKKLPIPPPPPPPDGK